MSTAVHTTDPAPLLGPESARSSAKAEHATTRLKDVNRCAVRPVDLIAHQGYTVLVTGIHGWIDGGTQGFYLHQTRFLSRLKISIDSSEPKFVSANTVDHHFITAFYLAPTPAGGAAGPKRDREGAAAGEVVQKGIELQINAFTGDGLHLDLIVTNHAMRDTDVTLSLDLMADFADFNEYLAGKRQQTALVERRFDGGQRGGGALDFVYRHPKLDLASRIVIAGADSATDLGHAVALRLALEPHEPRIVSIDLSPKFEGTFHEPFYGLDGAFSDSSLPATSRRHWVEGCAQAVLGNTVVQAAWDQAVSDLASLQVLEGPSSEPWMLTAGMPNYTGLFGRDGYLTALQTAGLNPATLRGVLEVVSRYNAVTTDPELDAEPGKVLHQRQLGPLAKLGLSPFLHYYGDQSTPGLFLLAAAADFAHTNDAAFLHSLKPKLLGTLAWMRGNADELGFYPYQTRSKHGVKNQSWKDSGEAVLYPDGTDVANPIAMADIQALYYAGQQALGLAFAVMGDSDLSFRLLDDAAALKRRFNDAFWMPDERFFAIALDPDKKQVKTIASDPGACLAYGIADPDKALAVAKRLLAEDMFSGWGIRTLSSLHPAYNPFAYHLGTVWPSPNAVTASGLRRYGFDEEMFRVAEGLFAASQIFTLDRLPEVFGGHRRDARHPQSRALPRRLLPTGVVGGRGNPPRQRDAGPLCRSRPATHWWSTRPCPNGCPT